MRVIKIALNGFRNYEWETAEFIPGTNVISGQNAQGKTNLLEAVYMLSLGKSFRTRFDRELVGFGYSSAEILAQIESHGREQTVKISLVPGQGKKITVNSVKKTASELAETINTVLFSTEDLNIISEDIQTIYTSEDLAVVKDLLIDYNVSYIFVGAFEKEKFGEELNEDLLRSLGRVVFEDGSSGTFIVQVQGAGEEM